MSALETIIEELKGLLPSKLDEAASKIHALYEETLEERREHLKASAGLLSEEEGAAWLEALKDCERVDLESR